MYIFQTVVVCIMLTIVHEWAHAIIGIKFLGLTPEFVAIGIPFSRTIRGRVWSTHLYTWKRDGKVPIVISALLIGGGVAYKNEDYYKQGKYRQKVEMLLSGPVSNILIGFLTSIVVFGFINGLAIAWAFFSGAGGLLTGILTNGSLEAAINGSLIFQASSLASRLIGPWWLPVCMWLFWNFMVALFNLLPIPGLDGGHVITQGIQEIWGEKTVPTIKLIDSVFLVIWILLTFLMVFGLLHF